MKCICGYEYEYHFIYNGKKVVDKGDYKFIEIEGSFHVVNNDYYDSSDIVKLYACPKCGTIRMEDV